VCNRISPGPQQSTQRDVQTILRRLITVEGRNEIA